MKKEIVAGRIGNNITNDFLVLGDNAADVEEWIDRETMKRMASTDPELKAQWAKIAQGPTLFLRDDETGVITLPITGMILTPPRKH